MVVIIASVQVPISSNVVPSRARPASQDAQTVQVPPNPSVPAPEPARTLVVMVASVQMPVRAHSAPVALVIAVQCAQAVQVHTNAPVPSPSPLSAAMHAVVVMIAAPQVPVAAHVVPACTIPATENSQSVQMTANSAVSTPEPARASVVVVATPQVPV